MNGLLFQARTLLRAQKRELYFSIHRRLLSQSHSLTTRLLTVITQIVQRMQWTSFSR
jgi:hypothetical protein